MIMLFLIYYGYILIYWFAIYSFNEHIFDTIDTEEKAYWLGFLEADGYNHESHRCVAIRLSYDDYHHLEKFKEFVQYTGPIYTFERLTPVSKTLKKYCELNLCSVIFSEALAKLGCVQGKTYTLELVRVRGVFNDTNPLSLGKEIKGFRFAHHLVKFN